MKFHAPLIPARLIRRYKRFLADVILENGEEITVHCANSGSMMGLKDEGLPVLVSPAANPKRKLKFTLELVKGANRKTASWVGVNTSLPNKIVEEAINRENISELSGYETLRREVKYGKNSRIDILLEDPEKGLCYVEVKSVTLRRDKKPGNKGLAEFPDAVTARGTKHLVELCDMVRQGHRSVMLYLVQRGDCEKFDLARDIDPAYGEAYSEAAKVGVEFLCYRCHLNPVGITLKSPLPFASSR